MKRFHPYEVVELLYGIKEKFLHNPKPFIFLGCKDTHIFPKELISVFRKILPLSKIYFILPYWRINHVQPSYSRNISAKIQKNIQKSGYMDGFC